MLKQNTNPPYIVRGLTQSPLCAGMRLTPNWSLSLCLINRTSCVGVFINSAEWALCEKRQSLRKLRHVTARRINTLASTQLMVVCCRDPGRLGSARKQVTTDTTWDQKMQLQSIVKELRDLMWAGRIVRVCVHPQATQLPGGVVHGSPAEGSSKWNINSRSVLSSSLLFFLSDDGPVPQHGPAQRSMVQAELIYPSAVHSNLNKQISPYQHLEPLTYRGPRKPTQPSLFVSVCVCVCVCVYKQVSVYQYEPMCDHVVDV